MAIGPGIALVAIGLLIALFLHSTIGIILLVVGAIAILLSFMGVGPAAGRREVVVERRRPAREREVIRERDTL